jgi:hypothetical protein
MNYNPGEALRSTDLNLAQKILQERLISGYRFYDREMEYLSHFPRLNSDTTPYFGATYTDAYAIAEHITERVYCSGYSFAVNANASLTLTVNPGVLAVYDAILPPSDSEAVKFARKDTTTDFVFGAADGANPRLDIVTVKIDEATGDSASVNFEDASTRAKSSQSLDKRLVFSPTFTVTAGTPAGSPSIPAIPAGERLLYVVRIPALATTINQDDIEDHSFPLGGRIHAVMVFPDEFVGNGVSTVTSMRTRRPGAAASRWGVMAREFAGDGGARLLGFSSGGLTKDGAGAEVVSHNVVRSSSYQGDTTTFSGTRTYTGGTVLASLGTYNDINNGNAESFGRSGIGSVSAPSGAGSQPMPLWCGGYKFRSRERSRFSFADSRASSLAFDINITSLPNATDELLPVYMYIMK